MISHPIFIMMVFYGCTPVTSQRTLQHSSPVSASTCPENKIEWQTKANMRNCSNNAIYACIPDSNDNLWEVCTDNFSVPPGKSKSVRNNKTNI